MTDDLVTFLRARLDEDEQVAHAVPGPSWERREIRSDDESTVFETYVAVADPDRNRVVLSDVDDKVLPFLLRHDPARVLREVEAKRQLVKLHGRATLHAGGGAQHFATQTVCRSCEPDYQFPEQSWPCPTLRLLALPYAGHPDYLEEWRP